MFSLSATPYVPGQAVGSLRHGPSASAPDVVVVLHQYELAALSGLPAGIILVNASPLSHPTLRLLSRGIPTVLIEQEQLDGLEEGMAVFLNGYSGLLTQPAPTNLETRFAPPPPEAGKPVYTLDRASVELRASVGSIEAGATALNLGSASIGLVRTEYLFPENGNQPDTDFLVSAFDHICKAAQPLPVTFRLVDIAGDKKPPWVDDAPGIAGVLGLQGARLYSTNPVRQVYLDELKALSILSGKYRISVLLPYVTSPGELERLVTEIRQYLSPEVPIGVMLETPAAALNVHEFLDIADFAALGCNDLMQCIYAADRDQTELRKFLDFYSPALFRFLDLVAQQASSRIGKIQVCGLLPQWPNILPVLIGLGYRAFSVDPIMIPLLAQRVACTDSTLAVRQAKEVCNAGKENNVREILQVVNE